ncbi:DUF1206 domain-containing protein [Kocuria rosea]|jgi:hypothetical protein|uniref:DUF1206 domain-containing protein n=2 Tax=Micrococcaceae TaxID=1268 RepID=UPI000D6521D3|nr:DUF1206 domain-containing protein [Kocuria rosea]MCC5781791.1 hypothetical protein [Kocuria sp. CCUG 69068]MEB2526136.1 DUF1206 domain-containing protein [Kocuria rosea]MEB2619316.1 DUF1206 domain-containing protein [Kocuria rosea]PWF84958.1 DUF1206 domain-containing protein [Kocuria rosea]QCY33267.1 DUF1206 domain-containing protein [Kocuria rosea]
MGEVGRQATRAADAADDATDSRGFVLAARAGYVAAGLLHVMIGVIALRVATGGSGSADQSGAVAALAGSPGGTVLLWACFLGCAALAVFLFSEIFFGATQRSDRDRLKHRVKMGGQAVVYGAIGAVFGTYALGGTSDSSGSTQSLSARLMAHPAGTVLLIAVGLGLVVAGAFFVHRGVTRSFRENLKSLPPGTAGRAVMWLGTAGYAAKGVALAVLGVLVVVATVRSDPEQSSGLDGALKALQEQPFGAWILGAVALGLICYGVFMVVRARYQRM